jgi:hypothetical protein
LIINKLLNLRVIVQSLAPDTRGMEQQ